MNDSRTFERNEALKKLWADAYYIGSATIPISANPLSAYILYQRLTSYRKTIRQFKLNPLYSEEWNRIRSCVLLKPKFQDKQIILRRKTTSELLCKDKRELVNYPLNCLNLPRSTYE